MLVKSSRFTARTKDDASKILESIARAKSNSFDRTATLTTKNYWGSNHTKHSINASSIIRL